MSGWYCLRTKLKNERIALSSLSEELGVECFLPMACLRRRSRSGVKLGQEPLFPGYLFARVDLEFELRKVKYARGVSGFVQLGNRFPQVADSVISDVRRFCEELARVAAGSEVLAVGDSVELVGSLFGEIKGEVRELLPAKNRIKVLVEFLSRAVEVSVPFEQVWKEKGA